MEAVLIATMAVLEAAAVVIESVSTPAAVSTAAAAVMADISESAIEARRRPNGVQI
jgi:hypothetical protein